jgi:hypothetical protein
MSEGYGLRGVVVVTGTSPEASVPNRMTRAFGLGPPTDVRMSAVGSVRPVPTFEQVQAMVRLETARDRWMDDTENLSENLEAYWQAEQHALEVGCEPEKVAWPKEDLARDERDLGQQLSTERTNPSIEHQPDQGIDIDD